MPILTFYNGAMQTTAAPVKVATGTSIKTMLQVKPSATLIAKVIEWGVSFDGSAAATSGVVELIETDVAATVTAYVANDITKVDADALMCGDVTTNLIQVGTSASGYTSSNEGTPAAVRNLDAPQLIAPTSQFIKQFALGNYPVIQVNKFLRIRVTFGATVNCFCYVVLSL
jgi:hypothetical protein